MRKYIPWIIVASVAILLALSTLLLYKTVSGVEVQNFEVKKEYELQGDVVASQDKGWLGELADKKNEKFMLPTTELQIKLEDNQKKELIEVYRIEIEKLDSYKFFCLNQVFKANGIEYSYYKKDGYIKLVIVTPDKVELESILKELKKYGIEYKLDKTYEE